MPAVSARRRAIALAAVLLSALLHSSAGTAAQFLAVDNRSLVVALSRMLGAVLFGVAASGLSFRVAAASCAVGSALAFLMFALTSVSAVAWLSLPLIAFSAALQVVACMLVLDNIASCGRREQAVWWLLADSVVLLSLLFAPGLRVTLLSGGGVLACSALLAVSLTHARPASPQAAVAWRTAALVFGAGWVTRFALSVLTLSSTQALHAGKSVGPFVIASILGQLALVAFVALSRVISENRASELVFVAWLMIGAAPLLPWTTFADVSTLGAISGASHGCVAGASSLLLLTFLRILPRPLQPLAFACWLCTRPLVDGATWLCESLIRQNPAARAPLAFAAVVLLLATASMLLGAARKARAASWTVL